MLLMQSNELSKAATVFADGFVSDPAFALLLAEVKDKKSLLQQYFLTYISNCKELLLYKYSPMGEGYLCIYRHDTVFAEFDIPKPLDDLEQFQVLEQYYKDNFAVLDIMAVEPSCRGRGIAGEMIDFFVSYCQQENLLPLVEVFSDAHLGLYRSHGFEVAHSCCQKGITTYILEHKK